MHLLQSFYSFGDNCQTSVDVELLPLPVGIGDVGALLDALVHRLGDIEGRKDRHLGKRRHRRSDGEQQNENEPQSGLDRLDHWGAPLVRSEVEA